MVYDPAQKDSPCYQCLYPEAGETEESCSENGIIAPLIGIIGSMQALETIKLLAGLNTSGTGKSTSRRLLLFDDLTMQWRELKKNIDPRCPVCGS